MLRSFGALLAVFLSITSRVSGQCTFHDDPNCAQWVAEDYCQNQTISMDEKAMNCGIACGLCDPAYCMDAVATCQSLIDTQDFCNSDHISTAMKFAYCCASCQAFLYGTSSTTTPTTIRNAVTSTSTTTTTTTSDAVTSIPSSAGSSSKPRYTETVVAAATQFAVLGVFAIAAIIFLVSQRRARRKAAHNLANAEANISGVSISTVSCPTLDASCATKSSRPQDSDEWEIERDAIIVDEMAPLGQGAFGVVFLGRLVYNAQPVHADSYSIETTTGYTNQRIVAVKTVSETAGPSSHLSFMDEINLMKSIGYHDNVVNLLACVTASDPPYLIMEYCSQGDLQNFLRTRKDSFALSTPQYVSYDSEAEHEQVTITPKLQLRFAVQIASAMEYLASRNFVHRDLAARNVLVDDRITCKVADFGLCRRVEQIDYYYTGKGGRLPLKWMSPEAIEEFRFTIESDVFIRITLASDSASRVRISKIFVFDYEDVGNGNEKDAETKRKKGVSNKEVPKLYNYFSWSYGIVLYEIFSLGGVPYADCPVAELLIRLLDGYRMQKPPNCPPNIYQLMLECWDEEAKQRPSFTESNKRLTTMLEEDNHYYVNSDAIDIV